jgi:hypothetical protein
MATTTSRYGSSCNEKLAASDLRRYRRRGRGRGPGRGHGSRVTYRHGDFVELAESVPPADIVTFDRVISVYPGLDRLAGLSAERARRLFGLVYPRVTRIVRLDEIERVVSEKGLSPHFCRRVGRRVAG